MSASTAITSTEIAVSDKSKILVLDDQPPNVELLEAVLADAGYQNVKGITDSRQAVDVHRTFRPDLILLDLMMPHMDGFAFLKALHGEEHGSFKPVMVVTADENQETRQRALNAGATDFMLKPFAVSELLARIELLLSQQMAACHNRCSGTVSLD